MIFLNFHVIAQPASTAEAAKWILYAHVGFNAILLIVCLPLAGAMEKLTQWIIPDDELINSAGETLQEPKSALDTSILHSPQLGLACASRECLRMADVINVMLTPVMHLYEKPDQTAKHNILDLEQQINKMHSDINKAMNSTTNACNQAHRQALKPATFTWKPYVRCAR